MTETRAQDVGSVPRQATEFIDASKKWSRQYCPSYMDAASRGIGIGVPRRHDCLEKRHLPVDTDREGD